MSCFRLSSIRLIQSVLLLLLSALPSLTSAGPADEHQIKAAMIYNMAKFTDWPQEALPADQKQFNICVMGRGPLATALESLQSKSVRNRNIAVRSIVSHSESSGCQILVIAESDRRQLAAIIDKTKNSRIMTVSDSAGFASAGGVLGFYLENSRLRLEINTTAAQRHKLRIDAQVLRLARIVQDTQ